mgnify:CR=1 FL=1
MVTEHEPKREEEEVVIKKSKEEEEDVEKLKELLKAVSDFIKELKEPIADILNVFMSSMSGDKVGSDVASFYNKLIESGMSKELAEELTKKYFEERISAAKLAENIMRKLGGVGGIGMLGGPKVGKPKTIKIVGEEGKEIEVRIGREEKEEEEGEEEEEE